VTLTNSDSSALIRPNQAEGGPTDLLFRKTDFLDFLRANGRVRQWAGSSPMEWALTYSGNGSAELYAESQAAPEPGKRTFALASVRPWYARAMAAITGHVRDQIARGGTFENLMDGELEDALKALMYLIETTLCGSAADKGIGNLIDSADTAHGIAPGDVSLWASLETGTIGTLDVADFQDFFVSLNQRGAQPSVILGNVNQMKNYSNIQGPGATTTSLRGEYPEASGKPYDIGMFGKGMGFSGIPLTPIRTLATTELYWLDLVNDDPAFYLMRDILTEKMAKRNDDDQYMLTIAGAMKVPNRRLHGKQTGITA
jgi:hypothetical protein